MCRRGGGSSSNELVVLDFFFVVPVEAIADHLAVAFRTTREW
jgi:hypothetical protein